VGELADPDDNMDCENRGNEKAVVEDGKIFVYHRHWDDGCYDTSASLTFESMRKPPNQV
jgi:hypothetical protein